MATEKEAFSRTISLVGENAFAVLQKSRVLLVGLGGVGGAAAEVLVRGGVGNITFVDGDDFEPSNLNRQLLCTVSELKKNKAAVAAQRAKSINADINVTAIPQFVSADNIGKIISEDYDYCIDAIDDLPNKVLLISECKKHGINIISALGAGNRIGCDFCITDIYKTKDDPFARKLRHELKKAGVLSLDVACALSPPLVKHGTPSSISAPPLVMGAMLANFAIRKIINL
ncbi:MAG: ThiF family adenylyltransferase [Clostridiales bacterium]|nr:ThiF family adenylyltransferase [Clostridiales bacterium]